MLIEIEKSDKKNKKNKWGEKKREFISFLIHIVFKNTS